MPQLPTIPRRLALGVRRQTYTGEQVATMMLATVTLLVTIVDIANDARPLNWLGITGPPLLVLIDFNPWLAVLGLGVVSTATLAGSGYNGVVIATWFACGLLVARGQHKQLLALIGCLVAGLVVLGLRGKPLLAPTGVTAIWVLVSMLVGTALSRAYKRLGQETAAHAEALRSQRNMIARELHDTLARANTFMVLRAQQAAAELDDGPGDQAAVHQALEDIIRTGHQSVSDLRTMLRVLREDDPQGLQTPTIMPDLANALEDAHTTLNAANVRATISNSVDISQLSPSVARALAYILNESVANMVKYAAKDAQCTIQLEGEDGRVELLTINPLADHHSKSAATSSNLGLIGIKERASALGGIARATQNGHQWLLHVTIPYEQKEQHGQQAH